MYRPSEPNAWPLTNPQTKAGKQGAELHAAWVEQFVRVEQVEADHAEAAAELRAAEAAISDAETAKASADAEKRYAVARDAMNGPWQARLKGPVDGCYKAEYALREHMTESLAEILSEPELADAAEDAREAVMVAAQAQAEAFAEWQSSADAHRAVVKLADGIDGRAIPSLSEPARAASAAIERMLAAEATSPVMGSNALQAPRVLTDAIP